MPSDSQGRHRETAQDVYATPRRSTAGQLRRPVLGSSQSWPLPDRLLTDRCGDQLRDQGRHVRVNLSLAASPAVRAALRAAVPDHRAAGFDDTTRALLAA